eukprot:252377-Chlamydomonas_euryale.AAC.1
MPLDAPPHSTLRTTQGSTSLQAPPVPVPHQVLRHKGGACVHISSLQGLPLELCSAFCFLLAPAPTPT